MQTRPRCPLPRRMARESLDLISAQPGALARFNELTAEAARRELAAVCEAPGWIEAMLSGRPFPDVAGALACSDEAVHGLTEADLAAALAGHPRIGARRPAAVGGGPAEFAVGPGPGPDWSSREQARVLAADAATIGLLAEGNADYERRFGHIYLVCASGRSADELLALLRERLANDDATEWQVVRTELAKINQIRLRTLLRGEP